MPGTPDAEFLRELGGIIQQKYSFASGHPSLYYLIRNLFIEGWVATEQRAGIDRSVDTNFRAKGSDVPKVLFL
jgi:hypothetical protein